MWSQCPTNCNGKRIRIRGCHLKDEVVSQGLCRGEGSQAEVCKVDQNCWNSKEEKNNE